LGSLVAACSSDSGSSTGTADTAATGDAGTGSDTTTAADATTGGDTAAISDTTAGEDVGTATDTAAAGDTAAPTDTAGPTDVATADVTPPLSSCAEAGDCALAACQAAGGAAGCAGACVANASAEVKATFAPAWTCIDTTCFKGVCKGVSDATCMDDCVGQKCVMDIVACVATGAPGTGSCAGATQCFDDCKTAGVKSFACWGGCWNAMSAADQKRLEALGLCLSGSASSKPEEDCGLEMVKCIVGDKTGPGSCVDIMQCFEACPDKDDLSCISGCVSAATQEAQALFADASSCFGKDMAEGCIAKYMACAQPSGTKSCGEGLACIQNTCAGKDGPGCPLKCAHELQPASASKLADLMGCTIPCQDKCNQDKVCEDACTTKTCGTQLVACLGG